MSRAAGRPVPRPGSERLGSTTWRRFRQVPGSAHPGVPDGDGSPTKEGPSGVSPHLGRVVEVWGQRDVSSSHLSRPLSGPNSPALGGGMCPLSKLGALEGSDGSGTSAQPLLGARLALGWGRDQWGGSSETPDPRGARLTLATTTVCQSSPGDPPTEHFAQLPHLVQGRYESWKVKAAGVKLP